MSNKVDNKSNDRRSVNFVRQRSRRINRPRLRSNPMFLTPNHEPEPLGLRPRLCHENALRATRKAAAHGRRSTKRLSSFSRTLCDSVGSAFHRRPRVSDPASTFPSRPTIRSSKIERSASLSISTPFSRALARAFGVASQPSLRNAARFCGACANATHIATKRVRLNRWR